MMYIIIGEEEWFSVEQQVSNIAGLICKSGGRKKLEHEMSS